jgi:hypothetical protein
MIVETPALLDSGRQFQSATWFEDAIETIAIVAGTYFKFTNESRSIAHATLGFFNQPGGATIHSMGSTSLRMRQGPVAGRLERVVDPDDGGKWCWLMQANRTDPDTASVDAKRTEFCFVPNILENGTYTLGYKVRIANHHTATDQFLVLQIHGDDVVLGPPPFAIYIQGAQLRVSNRGPSGVEIPVYVDTYTPNQWISFVFRFSMSHAGGTFEGWRNGVKIADRQGPLGYNPTTGNYLKSGIYQWGSAGNVWDLSHPMKTIHAKGPYLCQNADVTAMIDYVQAL